MRRADYRATLILMLGLAAATLTGFLREAALADQLGVGRATDIYLIAFTVPEFVFIALPIVLTPAFLPLFAQLRLRAGESAAWRFAGRVAGTVMAFLLALTLLIAVAAPLYLPWLAPGFGPLERTLAGQALYLMLPSILLMGGAVLGSAILQVYRRFARPALTAATYNLVFVAALLGLPLLWPVGRAAWGVTLGAAAALVILLPLLWRHRPAADEVTREAKPSPITLNDFVRLAGPLAAGYAVHHLILFIDRAMATMLATGSVGALHYAYRLALVVGQLSGLAVSTALFPSMAEQAASGDVAGLRASLAGGLRFVWAVGLPASAGLILLRTPLVQVLFEHGAFDPAATAAVTGPLVWYAVAVLADALCQPLWRVLYAVRRAGTVLAVNGLQTAARFLANIALIETLGYNGLALSAALGLLLQLAVLGWLTHRHLGPYLSRAWRLSALKVVLATAAALLVAGLLLSRLSAALPLWQLVLSGGLGAITYLLVLRLLEKHSS